MATVVSFATHKGGVGKTCSAMAVAAALARRGKRTLLVDLDPQGHAGIGLGVIPEEGAATVASLFGKNPAKARDVIHPTHLENLALLPATLELRDTALYLAGRPRSEDLLKQALEPIASEYDFIVLDSPPSSGVLQSIVVATSDFIIIPSPLEARASDAVADFLEIVDLIHFGKFDQWRILLTKVDNRSPDSNRIGRAGLQAYTDEGRTLSTEIPISVPLNKAQVERTDIFTFDPRCTGAKAYDELTSEILELLNHDA